MQGDSVWFYLAMLVIAFISWVFNRIQEATAERRRAAELKRRREEIGRQPPVAEAPSYGTPPPLPPNPEPREVVASPKEQFDDALQELKEALGMPPREKSSPPQPARPFPGNEARRPAASRQERTAVSPQPPRDPREKLSAAEKAALERLKLAERPVTLHRPKPKRSSRKGNGKVAADIRKLIAAPGGLKKAVVLKELLDAPVSQRDLRH